MDKRYEKLLACRDFIRTRTDFVPRVALTLGSGLGGFADEIEKVCEVSYSEIPNFPQSTVHGHAGRFVFGYIGDVPVVCMQGRVHFYEGYEISDIILPTRLMRLLGAEILFLTNASGGVNPEFEAGSFMLITDHIATFFPSPLAGPNIEELGTRFPDMTGVYTKDLCDKIRLSAAENEIPLNEGVYCQVPGPNFESPAEIRMMGMMGVGAVGMSTAVEAIAARHCGMKVCGISCVTNKGAGISATPLSHEEVNESAAKAAPLFKKLMRASIEKM